MMTLVNWCLGSVVVLLCVRSTCALTGYDCVTKKSNITAISMSTVKTCDHPPSTKSQEQVTVQLLQRKSYDQIEITACLLEVSTFITHCGMHSHATLAMDGFTINEIWPIAAEPCRHLHTYGEYKTASGNVLSGFKPNSTRVITLVDVGSIGDPNGGCNGGLYNRNGLQYSSVVVTRSYKITLRTEYALIDLENGKLRVSSGYNYNWMEGSQFDASYGCIFWDISSLSKECSTESHLVLYEGVATISETTDGKQTLMISTDQHAMAVGLGPPSLVCHQHGYSTEHPKLSVILASGAGFFFQKSTITPENLDMFLYTNSKFVFLERHFAGQFDTLYAHFHAKICLLKHASLMHLISLAYISPTEFAWAYTQRPGVPALLRGGC